MTSTSYVVALFLIVPTAFAQRSGGVAGGFARGGGPAEAHAASPGSVGRRIAGPNRGLPHREIRRFRYGPGYGFGWPYLPLWDDDFYPPYSPAYADQSGSETGVVQRKIAETIPPPTKPPSPVIHEYNFDNEPPEPIGAQKTLTIVLKDGSTRSATTSWVQDGELHYLDSRSLQQTLSPEVIDRGATERANEQKNLRMELPLG